MRFILLPQNISFYYNLLEQLKKEIFTDNTHTGVKYKNLIICLHNATGTYHGEKSEKIFYKCAQNLFHYVLQSFAIIALLSLSDIVTQDVSNQQILV